MLDSHKIYNILKASFSPEQAEVLTNVVSEAFLDFSRLVTKQEFSELVESQRRINEALNQLTVRVNELAEAQKQTEQRLNELAEAQRQTEIRLNELAEIQKNTEKNIEKRFNDITEVQRKADERFNALNETVQKLIQELVEMRLQFSAEIKDIRLQFGEEIKDIRQQLGGLAVAVGYGIEDKVMPYFFDLAKKDYAIQLERVDRRNYTYSDGRYDEINIFAEGIKGGKKHIIVAECKAQPSKKDADRFMRW